MWNKLNLLNVSERTELLTWTLEYRRRGEKTKPKTFIWCRNEWFDVTKWTLSDQDFKVKSILQIWTFVLSEELARLSYTYADRATGLLPLEVIRGGYSSQFYSFGGLLVTSKL